METLVRTNINSSYINTIIERTNISTTFLNYFFNSIVANFEFNFKFSTNIQTIKG